jgi:thiol:disulfide interchange protein DsbC
MHIWCSKNPSEAWAKWMLQNTEPGDAKCAGVPIDKLQTLGRKLHVDSTPTLFTVDGKPTRGAIKHNAIEELLASAHK